MKNNVNGGEPACLRSSRLGWGRTQLRWLSVLLLTSGAVLWGCETEPTPEPAAPIGAEQAESVASAQGALTGVFVPVVVDSCVDASSFQLVGSADTCCFDVRFLNKCAGTTSVSLAPLGGATVVSATYAQGYVQGAGSITTWQSVTGMIPAGWQTLGTICLDPANDTGLGQVRFSVVASTQKRLGQATVPFACAVKGACCYQGECFEGTKAACAETWGISLKDPFLNEVFSPNKTCAQVDCPQSCCKVTVDLTVDNVYALYRGTSKAIIEQIGYDNDWRNAETYSTCLNAGEYLYVAAWSDAGVFQGMLSRVSGPAAVYENGTGWEVQPTGQGIPVFSPAPSAATINAYLPNSFIAPVIGPLNAVYPGLNVPSMPSGARWIWHNSGKCQGTHQPFRAGCNHDEFLLFRFAGQQVCEVPKGACCTQQAGCQDLTADQCKAQLGTFTAGTSCDKLPAGACCPADEIPVACCFGASCEQLTPCKCAAAGGTAFAGQTCEAAAQICCDETKVGACCTDNGCFEKTTQCKCNGLGGTFYAGSTCKRIEKICCNDATMGACCFGSDCKQVKACECASMGGAFNPGASCQEAGVCCSDTTMGACCYKDVTGAPKCKDGMNPCQCEAVGGTFSSEKSCKTGACEEPCCDVTFTFSVDNFYGMYLGNSTQVNTVLGTHGAWSYPASFTACVKPSDVLYIAAWSDKGVHQGLLGQVDGPSGQILTGSDFQVLATAQNLPNGAGNAPSPATVSSYLGGTFGPVALGNLNANISPISFVSGISAQARWIWYQSGKCPGPNSPFRPGCNHDEFLIFRLPVGQMCTEPEGACCTPKGCMQTTKKACEAMKGLFSADKSCDEVDCCEFTPAGACCVDGGCLEGSSECGCNLIGGNHFPGLSCKQAKPLCCQNEAPTACCFGGQFCQLLAPCVCADFGGVSFDGASCEDVEELCCPDATIGACCSANGCTDGVNSCKCEALGGTFHVGEMCDALGELCCPDQTLGACCTGEGCFDGKNSCGCKALGGTFYAFQGCADIKAFCCPNPEFGACCTQLPTGATVCKEGVTECICDEQGGTFHGGQSCQQVAAQCCPDTTLGNCCTGDGCYDSVNVCQCNELGGNFKPGGSCTDTFACCFDDAPGSCCLGNSCETMTGCGCAVMGGVFFGGESCEQVAEICCEDLTQGACCTHDGCFDNVNKCQCDSWGGSFKPQQWCDAGACQSDCCEITMALASDNFLAVYTGTTGNATAYHGNHNSWSQAKTFTVCVQPGDVIYVAGWSDDAAYQGLVGQFVGPQGTLLTGDPAITVHATKHDLDAITQTPSLALLNGHLATASFGPSAVGPTNALWPPGTVSGIDNSARRIWYNSGKCSGANQPFWSGCNHDEYLIFQVPADLLCAEPEPTGACCVPASAGADGGCVDALTQAQCLAAGGAFSLGQTCDQVNCCDCPEGYSPIPDGSGCFMLETVAPTVGTTTYTVCAGDTNGAYSIHGTRFSTSLVPGDFEIPETGSTASTCTNPATCLADTTLGVGYLSQVGVWTCQNPRPTNTWIGFSQCVTFPEAGEYLIGIAGDNQVMLRLDGTTIYQSASSLNFRTWNVLRVPVGAGTRIIELFGLDNGGAAAFGAEIWGPYPAGALATPTAMRDAYVAAINAPGTPNRVFSTQPLRTLNPAKAFDSSLNGNSGFSCPQGFALDLCGAAPTCTRRTEVPCLDPEPVGACCLPASAGALGGCIDDIPESECVSAGGAFTADASCSEVDCCDQTVLGACCLGNECIETVECECNGAGGVFFLSTPCEEILPICCEDLTPGACCGIKPTGEPYCLDNVNACECEAAGGSFNAQATCDSGICEPEPCCEVSFTFSVDNFYGMYLGDSAQAHTMLGTHGAWSYPATFTACVKPSDVLYIAAWSDKGVHQGLLGQVDGPFGQVLTGSDFQVLATGQNLPNGAGNAPSLATVSGYLGGAFGPVAVGNLNANISPISFVGGISAQSRWIWYQSGRCPGPNSPFRPGCNHDEFLIFRLPVGQMCTEPEGACCTPKGCMQTTQLDCEAMQGQFSAGKNCDEVNCCEFTPVGACCSHNGCFDDWNECGCNAMGGTHFPGLTCQQAKPICCQNEAPTACCFGGQFCQLLPPCVCADFGGVSFEGASCDEVEELCCPDSTLGSCCSGEGCLDGVNSCQCEGLGGTFHIGEMCDDLGELCCPDQTLGACCTGEGCFDGKNSCGCKALGGTFYAFQGCADIKAFCCPNPEFGACCTQLPTGATVCKEGVTECICDEQGGTFYGGMICQEVAAECCPDTTIGTCCTDEGCFDSINICQCNELGGSFKPFGQCSDPFACCFDDAPGSCCLGDSCETMTACGCSVMGGVFLGYETCDQVAQLCCDDVTEGACCTDVGCFDGINKCECASVGGTFKPQQWCDAGACDSSCCDVTFAGTVDNFMGYYIGNSSGAHTFVGAGAGPGKLNTFTACIKPGDSIYIATWSDKSQWQGLIGDFTGTAGGLSTGNSAISMYATGVNISGSAATPSLANVSAQIGLATWSPAVVGRANNNPVWPIFTITGVSNDARWIWNNNGLPHCQGAEAPFYPGCNHGEYILFKVDIDGICEDPEPTGACCLPASAVAAGGCVDAMAQSECFDAGGKFTASATCNEVDCCPCPEGYSPNPDGSGCFKLETTQPTVGTTTYTVCAGGTDSSYSMHGTRFSTTLVPSNFEIPATGNPSVTCTDPTTCLAVSNLGVGRLSQVGVWTCQTPGPVGSWIGFSQCLDVAEAGEYLVGIAGDNHVMLRLDGSTIYQSASNLNFRSWNVLRVPVGSGPHILELFGRDDGAPAAFGAEIWGPYPAGSLSTPQAMRDAYVAALNTPGLPNRIFSTQTLRNQVPPKAFDSSLNGGSGFSCPQGFALNLCGAAPTCTRRLEAPCQDPEPTGACCLPASAGALGGCLDDIPESECIDAGGNFSAGQMCSDVNCCDQTTFGACCFGDQCIETVECECNAAGGVFFIGTACQDILPICCNDLTTGACCGMHPTGAPFCIENVNSCECSVFGGTFNPMATCGSGICNPDPIGACCLPAAAGALGGCIDFIPESECWGAGGNFSDGMMCSEVNCCDQTVFGACCMGNECIETVECECNGVGGVFFISTPCADIASICCEDPTVGACCGMKPTGEPFCMDNVNACECDAIGGNFNAQSTCDTGICEPEPCCEITFRGTVDNFMSYYLGTDAGVHTYVGNGQGPGLLNTFTVCVQPGDSIYIAGWSDDSSWQGLIGDFFGPQGSLTTGNPAITMFSTGVDLDSLNQTPTLANVSQQLALATWSPTVVGRKNIDHVWPLFFINGVSNDAEWIWNNNGASSCQGPEAPFYPGCNHGEYILFKVDVAPLCAVPLEPTGACCRPGACFDDWTKKQCDAIVGTWNQGKTCDQNPCTSGSTCCIPIDPTTTPLEFCVANPANGMACDPDLCTQGPCLGACCTPTGCKPNLGQLECNANGGIFHQGKSCTAGLCPIVDPVGACCLPFACLDDIPQSECILLKGIFNLGTCSADPCGPPPPPTGACCGTKPDGTPACADGVTKEQCIQGGGTFNESNSCQEIQCGGGGTGGTCCMPLDPTTTPAEICEFNFNNNAICDPDLCFAVPCQSACCMPAGGCSDTIPANECMAMGGQPDPGNTCATAVCGALPTGACCLPFGGQMQCMDDVVALQCWGAGGQPVATKTCGEGACGTPGACCLPSGGCSDVDTADSCTAAMGTFTPNTTCFQQGPCVPTP